MELPYNRLQYHNKNNEQTKQKQSTATCNSLDKSQKQTKKKKMLQLYDFNHMKIENLQYWQKSE